MHIMKKKRKTPLHWGPCIKHKINISEPVLMSTIHMSHNFAERSFPFPLFEPAVLRLLQHAESKEDDVEGQPARGRPAVGPMRPARPWPWPCSVWLGQLQGQQQPSGEQVTPAARRLCVRWGRRRKERGTSGMAGWWLEARERASASRPWEHSLAAMAVHALAESTENREGVGRQVRGIRAA